MKKKIRMNYYSNALWPVVKLAQDIMHSIEDDPVSFILWKILFMSCAYSRFTSLLVQKCFENNGMQYNLKLCVR